MIEQDLYTMKLHETLQIIPRLMVTKVVGGWIYHSFESEKGEITAMVFVPDVQAVEIQGKVEVVQ